MKATKNTTQKTRVQRLAFTMVMTSLSLTALSSLTGCATTDWLEPDTRTKTSKEILVEDQVVAFGRSATSLPNMPANSVVIVGEKQSYVLSQGGTEFVNLLQNLDAKDIHLERDLIFKSENNDGHFAGTVSLSYAKIKDQFSRSDMQFFLQNGGKECTTNSDTRMMAQRFCFDTYIKGGVFPRVSNFAMVQSQNNQYEALSKPYSISIYTNKTTTTTNSINPIAKIITLPFALAFDVITLPFQILGQ